MADETGVNKSLSQQKSRNRAMLAEERQGQLIEILDKKRSMSVAELHRRLKVSGETIRRDITRLAADLLAAGKK